MYSVSLNEIINEFELEIVSENKRCEEISVTTSDINRPGLQLAEFMDYFGNDRIQIIGKVETSYLDGLSLKDRKKRIFELFKCGFPCMIIARNLPVTKELIAASKYYNIPILRTNDTTSRFMGELIKYLNVELAPRIIKHGVFIEVYGEGILILGDSGVGKSETALELLKRGHRLVADDVVEIRKVSEKTLVGTAPDIIRHFIEIRGIGILDIKNLYGMGAVKVTEAISLVISLEYWDNKKDYERLGLVDKQMDILGIKVPTLNVPVRPGRNLAVIVEVAAMNNRQKKMGYNAAKELNERVIDEINKDSEDR